MEERRKTKLRIPNKSLRPPKRDLPVPIRDLETERRQQLFPLLMSRPLNTKLKCLLLRQTLSKHPSLCPHLLSLLKLLSADSSTATSRQLLRKTLKMKKKLESLLRNRLTLRKSTPLTS
jgi:hypothetical protein